jgi:hypothetical protein
MGLARLGLSQRTALVLVIAGGAGAAILVAALAVHQGGGS